MTDVRESMRVLPFWSQPFLTWLTGKAHQGQNPLWASKPILQASTAVLSVVGGVAGSIYLLNIGSLALLGIPVCWLFTVGGARKIQVMINHQCTHYRFSGKKGWDRNIAQVLSTLIFVDNFDSYFREHIHIHHTKKLGSPIDPECAFVLSLGFKPGASKQELWKHLLKVMLSPSYHGRFIFSRYQANFVNPSHARVAASICWTLLIVILTLSCNAYLALAIGWLVPITVLYHVAALLNFSSLHFWLKESSPQQGTKARLTGLTAGRFCGEAVPEGKNPLHWAAWFTRMACYHLPVRIAVLAGDLPVHDYHHRYPRCPQWPDHLYTRQWDIDAGTPGWDLPYSEVWGLHNAVGGVFESLSVVGSDYLDETNGKFAAGNLIQM